MLKPLLACLIAAAPAALFAQTAPAAPAPAPGQWTIAGGASGCIAHSASARGTVVSILASPGQDTLLFVIQNRGWSTLRDGETSLALQLDGAKEWSFDAVGKTELDEDGPGYMFVVPPSAPFLTAFASASGMRLGSDGRAIDSVPIEGGAEAMAGLAQCMAQLMNGAIAAGEDGAPTFIRQTRDAVKL